MLKIIGRNPLTTKVAKVFAKFTKKVKKIYVLLHRENTTCPN